MAAVLVHIDLDGDRPDPSSLVALAAGRHVASSWGATLYAALIVRDDRYQGAPDATPPVATAAQLPGIEAIEQALARGGADKVVVAVTDTPVAPLWAAVGTAWQGIIDHLRPRLVLFGADSPSAGELGPRTGARIGARFLSRARVQDGDDVELRDRDGGYVRSVDGGAAVVLVGRAERAPTCDEDIDLVFLAIPGGADARIEVAGSTPAEVSHTAGAIVALGDDVIGEPTIVDDAKKLAALLGAPLVGSKAAATVVQAGAIIDRSTPLAPDLAVMIGKDQIDLAGSTSFIRIGAAAGKTADGALPAPASESLAELVKRLGGPVSDAGVVIWVGSAAPLRLIRWLDGAIAAGAKFGNATVVAAGESNWLDLATDRATRAGLQSVGVPTRLELDYLGWAQVVAAVMRELNATTAIVDEASRPERFPEVAAIAEEIDAAQLTRVVALAPDGSVVHASRIAGKMLQTVRIRGNAVIGVRIAGPVVDEYPTPMPSTSMRLFELEDLGLDPHVLGHRALPLRSSRQPKKSVERIAEHLAVHRAPRGS